MKARDPKGRYCVMCNRRGRRAGPENEKRGTLVSSSPAVFLIFSLSPLTPLNTPSTLIHFFLVKKNVRPSDLPLRPALEAGKDHCAFVILCSGFVLTRVRRASASTLRRLPRPSRWLLSTLLSVLPVSVWACTATTTALLLPLRLPSTAPRFSPVVTRDGWT